jgi:4-amino-4-deoxy-L-arabinose transferase-like glycosyltransferase
MEKNLRRQSLPLLILGLALVAWAGLFALGAYLELGADRPRYDFRKPIVVLATMALFLGAWGLLLWKRAGRVRRK